MERRKQFYFLVRRPCNILWRRLAASNCALWKIKWRLRQLALLLRMPFGMRESGASCKRERPRRLRRTEALRGLVRETRLTTAGLIYPMFVCPGSKVRQEVSSMPGVFQQSADQIVEECREVESLGISGIILFGLPESKDPRGANSLVSPGVV